ncbi:transposase [Marinitoga sp. 1154]|uniref:transposase n=1 Tax=Marinitoga sp. 1154 TaxID=1643335 RepID=UPI001585F7C9|nr:transposase [Marinitoga sp. 1154]
MQIYSELKKEGYKGSYGLVSIHTRKIRPEQKNNYIERENIQTIKRKTIIQHLYKPINKIKELTEEIIDKITDKYEYLKEIYEAVKEFKKVLFSKNTEKLHNWIKKYENSAIQGIQSFIHGIKRDIVAVENAIK